MLWMKINRATQEVYLLRGEILTCETVGRHVTTLSRLKSIKMSFRYLMLVHSRFMYVVQLFISFRILKRYFYLV